MAKLKRTVIVGGLSGSSGPVTFKLSREGTLITERTSPSNPNTPAQVAARTRFATVTRLWKTFTPAQEAAWQNYANTVQEFDAVTGKSNEQRAMQAFVALSTKFLQATPGGSIPLAPPTAPFTGDTVVVTATATTGKVTFTANQPNASNVTTEILLQPLASQIRNPQKGAYRTKKFFRFLPGSLSTDVDVPAGWYAAAVRFVKTTTGQVTPIQPIGISQVSFSVSESGSGSKKKAA